MANIFSNFRKKFKCNNENIRQRVKEYLNGNHNGYPPIGTWDVELVEDMDGLFAEAKSFNESINDWDVTGVKSMRYMFLGASSFNQPLDKWNVRYVRDMHGMFSGATSFNQPLNKWNVSNVALMSSMFGVVSRIYNFGKYWKPSSELLGMTFPGASSFNQPLNNWNVSEVRFTNDMFNGALSFNQDISNWNLNTYKGQNKNMFINCPIFEEYKPLSIHETRNQYSDNEIVREHDIVDRTRRTKPVIETHNNKNQTIYPWNNEDSSKDYMIDGIQRIKPVIETGNNKNMSKVYPWKNEWGPLEGGRRKRRTNKRRNNKRRTNKIRRNNKKTIKRSRK
jgi:surface protein